MKDLKQNLEEYIYEYIVAFEKKHECDFSGWIGDRIGEVAEFGDDFFDFSDIRRDLDQDRPKDEIYEWLHAAVEIGYYKFNYSSWIMGYRPMTQVEVFTERLDRIFAEGCPTKAQIIDAFHKSNPKSKEVL